MFTRKQLERYADILFWGLRKARINQYAPQDVILIRYDLAARELAEILFSKVLDSGMHPIQRIGASPEMEKSFFSLGTDEQLKFHPPGEKELMHNLNGTISLLAPESLRHLKDVDPSKIGKAALARKELRDILDERENSGEFGWTLCLLPTAELSQNAQLDEQEYAQQIIKACYLDHDDPLAKWEDIYSQASEIKTKLNNLDIKSLRVQSKNCDLVVTPGQGRQWIGISGHNIPSFELFTSPDWRGTKGIYFADQPSFRSGNYVSGVRLEFKEGEVVDIDAEEGKDFVKSQLAMDQGANKLGEFSLTDKRFSRIDRFMAHTLFDENFGGDYGNCHVAVGASYSDTYAPGAGKLNKELKRELGFNDSALHWDLVNTEPKTVTAEVKGGGSQVIYENGVFNL